MDRGKQLTEFVKAQIVLLSDQGHSNREISRQFGFNESSIRRFLKRYRSTGSTERAKGSGRKRCTTRKTDHLLKRLSLQNRFKTAPELKRDIEEATGSSISVATVKRRLQESGLNARRPAKKPLLTARMKKKRLEWAKERSNWTLKEWERVIFTDESKFVLFGSDKRASVRRREGERFKEGCILPTVKHSPNIMVWGAITSKGVGELIIVHGSINAAAYKKIIDEGLLPTVEKLTEDISDPIFQDDSAPCHRARSITDYKEELGISSLPWPGNSPDLNPIEHVWDQMGKKIQERKPRSIKELEQVVEKVWFTEITTEYLKELYESMSRRVNAVMKAKGGTTKY